MPILRTESFAFLSACCSDQRGGLGTDDTQPSNSGSPSITTKAFGILLPFLVGKALPAKACRSLIMAITRLRLGTKSIISAVFGSDVQGLMQPMLARKPWPGWIRISERWPVSLSSRPGLGLAEVLSES